MMIWWRKRLFCSLLLILCGLLNLQLLKAQDCPVKPDATLRDTKLTGQPFVNCTNSSTAGYTLKVANGSKTKTSNTFYSINWGDGSPVEDLGDFSVVKSHTYIQRGTYTLIFTVSAGNCTETQEYTVFHGSTPNVGLSYRNTDECAPATFSFDVTQTELNEPSTTYILDFGDGTTVTFDQNDSKTFTHTYNTPSKGKPLGYTITVTASNACKTANRTGSGIYVSNGPTPDFKLEPGPVSCVNSPVTLTDVSDYGYNASDPTLKQFERQWTIEPADGWSYAPGYDEKSEKPILNFTKTGNYVISINLAPLEGTDPKCKGGTVSKTLKIITPPSADFTTVLDPLSGCTSTVNTVNKSVGELISYQWTVTPNSGYTITSGSLTSATPVFQFNTAGNYQLSLKATNFCGSDQKSATFNIKNIATVTLPPAQTYCGPKTIAFSTNNTAHKPFYTFNNTSEITYAWSISGPSGGASFATSTGETSANPSINFSQPGVYTVSVAVTNECGTSTQASQKVTINAVPTSPEAENTTICINSSATLNTTATGTVEWWSASTGGTKLKTGTSYTTPVYNAAGNYTVYVQTTVNGCTSSRKAVTVTVSPAIDPKTITGASTICENSIPNQLSGPAATGGGNQISYLWESSTTSATATDFTAAEGKDNSPNNQQNFQPGTLVKTTYFRRKAIAAPCATVTSNVITITVNKLPEAPVVPAIQPVCAGNSATFTANAVSGISYVWYNENGTQLTNTSTASNSYTTTPLTQEGTFIYYVSGKSSSNCFSPRTRISVQVLPAINNNQIISQQPAICAGDTPGLIRSAMQPAGGNGYSTFTYVWQSKTDRDTEWKTAVNGINTEHTNNTENYQPAAITRTTSFRRQILSGSCATPSYSNEVVIEVIPSSLAPEVADVSSICSGQSTKLTITSTGGTYEWYASPTSQEVLFIGSIFTTPALTATTTYYVLNRTSNCVSPLTEVVVEVNPIITENKIEPVPAVCADGIPNKLIGSEPFGGKGPGTYTYRWESRTEFTQFAPINGDATFSASKKDYQPGMLNEPTWYRRIVRSGSCEDFSTEIKVDVLKVITGNTIAASNGVEFCADAVTANLINTGTISGGTGQYMYVWESSTDEFKTNKTIVAQGQEATFANYSPQNLTQTTWFRRVITSGPCLASTSNTVKIIINPLPAAPVVNPINPVCAGSSVTITAVPVNGITFSLLDEEGNSLPTNNSGGNSFTTTALTEPKTYTYYVLAKNNSNCNSIRTTVTVQVLPPLNNFNITQPEPVCSGESPSEITSVGQPTGGNNTFTYIWQSKAGQEEFKTISSSSTNPGYKPGALIETTWFRRIISSGPCSEYSNVVEVKVNPQIVNTLKSGNQEICEDVRPDKITGNPATGGDGITYSFLWESSLDNLHYTEAVARVGQSNTQIDFQPGILSRGNHWFRRKVISGGCISYSTPILIKVTETISNNIIRLSGNLGICINTKPDPIQGSLPTGGNNKPAYIWQSSTDNITFTTITLNGNLQNYSPGVLTQPTWFRRLVTEASCQPDTSAPVKIEVYQLVTNNRIETPNQELCQGNTAIALKGSLPQLGNGDYKYRWESKEEKQTAFIIAPGNPFEKDYAPGILPKGTWYFRRWVTAGPCQETVSQFVKITVNDQISGHFITANQTIRVGDKPATLDGPKPNGGNGTFSYRWESSENNQTYTTASGIATQKGYAPPVLSKTTWFRRIAISGGCESVSNLVQITVAQAIANNTITTSQTICYNTEANPLTGSVPTGGDGEFTYIWEYSTTGLAADFITAPNGAHTQDYIPGKLKETTWFRRKVSSAGNTHISNVLKITVTDPISSNSITSSQTICFGTLPKALNGSGIVGGSGLPEYLWESSTDGITFITAPGNSSQKNYAPDGLTRTTWFRRKVSMVSCTSNTSNIVQITVLPIPVISPIDPIKICPGNSTTITVQSDAPQIEWYETATSSAVIHKGASFTTAVLQSDRTYYVQAISQGCISERMAVKVQLESPVADAGMDVTIKPGGNTQLQGKGGVSYKWFPEEGLNDPNIANPIVTPKQSTTYTLTVTTAEGCTATDQVVVNTLPGLFIPNGFTPDRDGINDTWEISNIENYPGCQVKVFNRWGTIIYSSEGYQQPWDGTYNKQDLPVATYYYTITLNKDEKPIAGSVTIIK